MSRWNMKFHTFIVTWGKLRDSGGCVGAKDAPTIVEANAVGMVLE